MRCEELLAALNEYVDGDLPPGICEAFETHLKGCNPCQVVIDNIRQTIRLYKAGEPFEMPAEFCNQLRGLLKEKWKAKFPQATGGK